MKKLGILGGSFNPIHNGHLAMAEAARKAHGLDGVLFVPAGNPPHKRAALAPAQDRLAMVRLALDGREGFEASDLEVNRPGTTYTVDTLEKLQLLYPDSELFFIIGEDSIPELAGWRDIHRVLRLARIVAVNRPGWEASYRAVDFPGVTASSLSRLEADRVTMPPSPIESSRIREAIRQGRRIDRDVPPSVAAYIHEHELYRAGPSENSC